MFIWMSQTPNTFKSTFESLPGVEIQFRDRFCFINFSRRIQISHFQRKIQISHFYNHTKGHLNPHITTLCGCQKSIPRQDFLINFSRRIQLHTFKVVQGRPRVTFQGESKFHPFTTIQGHLKAHTTTLYGCQKSILTQLLHSP